MSLNRLDLRNRVRTLTGVWSVDVVSDELINEFLNDAVVALEYSQDWQIPVPPSGFNTPTFSKMTSDTQTPGSFWDNYHPLLAYRAAGQVLAFEADDTNRGQFFAQEYAKMYTEMVEYFLPRAASGDVTDTAAIVRYVRDLTGQYGIDLPTNLIRRWLDEVYQELYATYAWPTSGTLSWPTSGSLTTTNPAYSEATRYNSVLAYRVASKILAAVPETQQRAAVYQAEYDRILAAMLSDFFPRYTGSALTTQAELVSHVRFLTTNYTRALSTDIIVQYLQDAQKELLNRNYWPSSVTSTFITGIPEDYRRILSLRAATRVLNGVAPQEQIVSLAAEYEAVLTEMKDALVRNAALGAATSVTFDDLKKHVRTLTGAWDASVSDTAIGNWINDAYTELAQDKDWPWLSTVDTEDYTLNAGTSKISLDSDLRVTATKNVQLSGSPSVSGTLVLSEEDGQQKWEFTTSTQPTPSAKLVPLDIVATHSLYNDEVSFTLQYDDVNDKYVGYNELELPGTWSVDISVALETGPTVYRTATTSISVPATVSRRVLGVYFLGGNYDGVPDQWLAAPHLLDIEEYAPRTVYDIADDGVLRWAPELSESGILRVQYVRNVTSLSAGSDEPLFATKFRPILAYRAAMRWASMNGDQNRVQTFQSEYNSMYEQMVNEYLLDHDTNPLQLGSEGLETRRYLPWFRTA